MKYGDYFENESVPRWSLYNIDYNSLKHQIKLHTTKGQAKAIAIPGQTDHALSRFEDHFYDELASQHDRVGLFVSCKADEISRRLAHLSSLVNNLILRCSGSLQGLNPKRQRRFAKYQQQIVDCGNDIRDLQRFVRAQVEAFRKILKKYKKWTGSTTLTSRFNENVLDSFKSFTRRDFHPLQLQYREVLSTLQASSPGIGSPIDQTASSDSTIVHPLHDPRHGSREHSRRSSQTPRPPVAAQPEPEIRGWNEYDNGSEAGDESYYITINPDESDSLPGMDMIRTVLGAPVKKIQSLFSRSSAKDVERQSLLPGSATPQADYFSIRRPSIPTTDGEGTEEEDDASSAEYPSHGYATHYASLPSIEEQRLGRYRELVLHRAIILSFAVAVVLTVVATILVATGRHKLQLEVDVGVTMAVVTSLFAGCMGLGAMLYRQDTLGWTYRSTVWVTYIAVCLLNGMLLVLVAGSSGL